MFLLQISCRTPLNMAKILHSDIFHPRILIVIRWEKEIPFELFLLLGSPWPTRDKSSAASQANGHLSLPSSARKQTTTKKQGAAAGSLQCLKDGWAERAGKRNSDVDVGKKRSYLTSFLLSFKDITLKAHQSTHSQLHEVFARVTRGLFSIKKRCIRYSEVL